MKNKITALSAFVLCICFLLCSCGADVSALENLCFAVRDFDLSKAAKYVGGEYFENILSLAEELTEEQTETAKEIYAAFSFSDFKETDGVCTFTLSYVDFNELIKAVNNESGAGASASESLRDVINSGRLKKQFVKSVSGVKVTLSKENGKVCVPLGRAGVNKDFTAKLGLDTFLGWYALQL